MRAALRNRPGDCARATPRTYAQGPALVSLLCLLTVFVLLHAPAGGAPYAYLTYAQMHARLATLAHDHPALLTIASAQDAHGLPSAGLCAEHPGSPPDVRAPAVPAPCRIWIATLTNHTSLRGDPARPEALVSGELHGDEVVGPHAVLAFIEYVLGAAAHSDDHALRTLNTRVLTFLPMANAIGFHRRERGERPDDEAMLPPVDPNRDFAFGQDASACMLTIAARAVNELFREHLFRLLITFHGGTNAIGYEWGDMAHCQGPICEPAPDTAIMEALANRMSSLAGPAGPYEVRYPTGNMGKLVYPVAGGMEDWAYGASWSPESVVCQPQTFGGYAIDKTTYGNGSNRCVTYLVETSSSKAPLEGTLGDSNAIFAPGAQGDGHIPRNVRLLLGAIDAIEPYIVINDTTSAPPGTSSLIGPPSSVDGGTGVISVSWFVGGAFTVDGTFVQWSSLQAIGAKRAPGTRDHGSTPVVQGTAGLFALGVRPTIFRTSMALFSPGNPLYFRIAVVVDSAMADRFKDAVPNVGFQSHLVGSRSSRMWSFATSSGTRRIQGHAVFYSATYRAEFIDSAGSARLVEDNSRKWGPDGTALISDTEDDTAKILTGRAPSVTPSRRNETPLLVPSSQPMAQPSKDTGDGNILTLDPRDRNAVVSGVVGVVAILMVTLAIVYKMWKHRDNFFRVHSEPEYVTANGEDSRELKEPLQSLDDDEDVTVFESSHVHRMVV
jgi:Zinc carboxypeptidase